MKGGRGDAKKVEQEGGEESGEKKWNTEVIGRPMFN